MSVLVKVDYIKAMYTLFCKLPPFDKFELPLASKIEWTIIDDRELCGSYSPEPHCITVSIARHSHFTSICKTLLHEMVHMVMYLQGKKYELHNKTFYKHVDKICSIYGFDPKEL